MKRLLWILTDYTIGAIIRALDAISGRPDQEGG